MPETKAEQSTSISVLLRDLGPRFRLISHRYRIDTPDAEDVLQNTLVRFLPLQHAIRDPAAWLSLVFRRECLRFLRRRNSRREDAVDPGQFEATVSSPPDLPHAERMTLTGAFKRLRPRYRRVLWWRYALGMSEAEVAEAAGFKAISAKKAISRALLALRRAME